MAKVGSAKVRSLGISKLTVTVKMSRSLRFRVFIAKILFNLAGKTLRADGTSVKVEVD